MTDYIDAAIQFLRGDWAVPGHVMAGARAWLPPGTRFDIHNAREREEAVRKLGGGSWAGDPYMKRRADGAYDETPLPDCVQQCVDCDSEHWFVLPSGRCVAQGQLGRRFLLVAHQGDEVMWLATCETRDDLATAIAAYATDHDAGATMAVDLETREPVPFRVHVTFD